MNWKCRANVKTKIGQKQSMCSLIINNESENAVVHV